jgi:putative glutamine amidotransferase
MYRVGRDMPAPKSPRIVVTLSAAADPAEAEAVARRSRRYLDAVRRHGGDPIGLDARTPQAQVEAALGSMDGLLLSGGGDFDPARYAQPNLGSIDIDPDRDALEAAAWAAAAARGLPVLGICRGLQAINVFSGGSLLQHVDGHSGAGYGTGDPATHPITVTPGTRLGALLAPPGEGAEGAEPLVVNAYHHQGVRRDDLAPGLVAAAWADSDAGPLVEGLEADGDRFVVGVQCHPERTESTPAAFERVFEAFVEAAR